MKRVDSAAVKNETAGKCLTKKKKKQV